MPHVSRGTHPRLARQIHEAALRATADELLALESLLAQVRRGDLGVFEAQRLLTGLLREQSQRHGRHRDAA